MALHVLARAEAERLAEADIRARCQGRTRKSRRARWLAERQAEVAREAERAERQTRWMERQMRRATSPCDAQLGA